MKTLASRLNQLDTRNNPEEKLMYQIIDLETVKYKGVESGDIVVGDDIYQALDVCIRGFIWLYDLGLNLVTSVREKLSNEHDQKRYEEIINQFATVNDFMRTHIHLKMV